MATVKVIQALVNEVVEIQWTDPKDGKRAVERRTAPPRSVSDARGAVYVETSANLLNPKVDGETR